MIDCEFEIFNEVAQRTREVYPGLYMVGEYVSAPAKFPCVSIVEIDNAAFRNSLTQEGWENHVAVTYEVNVFSNKENEKKLECKEIANVVDEILHGMNFTRMGLYPVTNLNDTSVYRMTGRYRAVIGKNHMIYRR